MIYMIYRRMWRLEGIVDRRGGGYTKHWTTIAILTLVEAKRVGGLLSPSPSQKWTYRSLLLCVEAMSFAACVCGCVSYRGPIFCIFVACVRVERDVIRCRFVKSHSGMRI